MRSWKAPGRVEVSREGEGHREERAIRAGGSKWREERDQGVGWKGLVGGPESSWGGRREIRRGNPACAEGAWSVRVEHPLGVGVPWGSGTGRGGEPPPLPGTHRLPCPPEPGSGPGPGAPPPPESLLERALLSERDGPRGGGGRARRRPLRRGAPAGDLERRLRRRLRLRRRRRACPPAARSPRPCDDGAERGLVLSFPRAGDGAAPASAWSPTLGEGELGF